MSIVNVTLADTFDQWRVKTNSIGTQTGDITSLATTDKTSIVAAINEIFNNDSDDMENLVDDTTPQLGGQLDLNNNNITGTGSINVTGAASFGGSVTTSGLISISNADISITPHGSGKTTVTGLKLIDNMDLNGQDITGTGSIAGAITGVTQSASDNSTKLATTAYVDTQVATENSLVEMDDVTITTPTNNQTLVYNAATSKWVNTAASAGATESFAVSMAIALG
jgi:predicted secreted protein